MTERPFLFAVTRDGDGHPVVMVQADGLVKKRLSRRDCWRYARDFMQAALDLEDNDLTRV